jgi:hypothetical protein
VRLGNRALTPIFAALAGCAADPSASVDKGYSLSAREPFHFEVDREVLREWGGAGSPKFNQVLEEELERLRICRNGYVLRQEGVRDGVFSVSGRCRS